jgi:hypothetical protein
MVMFGGCHDKVTQELLFVTEEELYCCQVNADRQVSREVIDQNNSSEYYWILLYVYFLGLFP